MKPFLYAIGGALLIGGVARAWFVWRASTLLLGARRSITDRNENPPHMIFLLPALGEASLVRETLDWFTRLQAELQREATIVVLASPEEGTVTTETEVDGWIEFHHSTKVRLMRDEESRSKQAKLRVAVEWLRHEGTIRDDTWIGIFDFDARPIPGSFAALERTIRAQDQLEVVQLLPVPAPHSRSTAFSGCLAIDHLRRVLLVETVLDQLELANRVMGRLRGCMGAAMVLRAGAIQKAAGFPFTSDDIELGYRLDILGARRALVTSPVFVEPAPSLKTYLRQQARVLRAVFAVDAAYEAVRPSVRLRRLLAKLSIYGVDFCAEIRAVLVLALALALAATGESGAAAFVISCYWLAELLLNAMLLSAAHRLYPAPPKWRTSLAYLALAGLFRPGRTLAGLAYYAFNRSRPGPAYSTPRHVDVHGISSQGRFS